MAKKFLTPIDLNRLEIQNAVVQNLATDPGTAVDGQIYYNTATDRLRVYANGSWSDVGAVTSITGTANEVNVSASVGAVTIGLPDNVDITGNLAVGGNLTVSGSTTYINTETVTVADNIIQLNSNVSASATPTENAGVEVNRGNEGSTALLWNESIDSWVRADDGVTGPSILFAGEAGSIDISDFDEAAQDAIGLIITDTATVNLTYNDETPELKADVKLQASNSYLTSASGVAVDISALETKLVTDSFTKKASTSVGNNAATSFAISHNLGTRDVVVNVYDNATYDTVEVDVVRTDANTVTVSFAQATGTNAYRVVIIG